MTLWAVCARVVIFKLVTACDNRNLGQNKMEEQNPHPSEIKDEAARRPKHPIFSIPDLGGGGFIFFIYRSVSKICPSKYKPPKLVTQKTLR